MAENKNISQELDVSEEADPATQQQALLQYFLKVASGFWGRHGTRMAWILSAAILALVLANLAAQYGINRWNKLLFDSIEKKDIDNTLQLTMIFLPLAAASVACGIAQVWARMGLQRRWREWMNNLILQRWLNAGRYYQLNLIGGDHDNPEFRIGSELRIATDAPVDFVTGIVSAFLSAATFISVLWAIGGDLTVTLGGSSIRIPGFLVVAAVTYSVIASGSMIFVGHRFVSVSEELNKSEADYRFLLSRVRENGESIALLGGEREERDGLIRSFKTVLERWRRLAHQHMRTTLISQGSGLLAPVVPVLLCAPKYLAGEMTLGSVMQAASAFTIVQTSFSWLVDNYPRLADWTANARRVAGLVAAVDSLESAGDTERDDRLQHGTAKSDYMLQLHNVSVTLSNGTAVVAETDVKIAAGERVFFAGESGSGKSTLVRAIAGLWPWGEGTIHIHEDRRLFMLPQRPYIPAGTLARVISYPGAEDDWTQEQLVAALELVGLGQIGERLMDEEAWDHILSGGEKQRIAFARVLLHRPDILVLDEATSALDAKSQDEVMQMILEQLPDTTIISVAHREELELFHTRKISLAKREGGARLVKDLALPKRRWRRRVQETLRKISTRNRNKTAKSRAAG